MKLQLVANPDTIDRIDTHRDPLLLIDACLFELNVMVDWEKI